MTNNDTTAKPEYRSDMRKAFKAASEVELEQVARYVARMVKGVREGTAVLHRRKITKAQMERATGYLAALVDTSWDA